MSTMNATNLEHNHEQDEKKVFSMVLITRYDYSMFNLSKWHIKVIKNRAI